MPQAQHNDRNEGAPNLVSTRVFLPGQSESWASYKHSPADFALTLVQHEGFDAIARLRTPPPSYSRHPQPKLSLLIPATDQNHNAEPTSSTQTVASDFCAIESVANSPIEAYVPKHIDVSLLNKVKAGLRKRSTGLRGKIRRSSGNSQTSSKSSSPDDVVPSSPAAQLLAPSFSTQPTSLCELPAIQEVYGQPTYAISGSSSVAELESTIASNLPGRTMSRTSIVPTPRRGLSVLSSSVESIQNAGMDPHDLSGRLASLDPRYPQVIVSSSAPTSPISVETLGSPTLLSRSNAVTDTILRQPNPISPLDGFVSLSVPPTTPTLDGRLDSLPRLNVPSESSSSISRADHTRPRDGVVEIDTSRVVVTPRSPVFSRLERPFGVPQWASTGLISRDRRDSASNAPELVAQDKCLHTDRHHFSSDPSSYPRYLTRSYVPSSSYASLVGWMCEAAVCVVEATSNFLKNHYGPEPPVPAGHIRVRWQCPCGDHLYDDYVENRPGAAAELETHLNKIPQAWANSPSSSHPTSANSSIFSAGGPSPLSSVSTWSSRSTLSPADYRSHEFAKQRSRIASTAFPYNINPYIDPLWLYTCVNEGRWTTKMKHLDVNSSKISSDKDLATSLGSLYSQVNRKWYKVLKLRGLVNIRFVQFELHRNRFADISRSPALPDIHSAEGSTYEFAPHDLTPPVGSNYLMHLFKHPEDYDDEIVAYMRTPKRRDRLEIGTGWGLELVEGFIAERFWGALIALLLIGSIVFAVAWTCRKGADVQGAFSIAAYMVGAGGLILAWAQAALD